MKLNRLAIIPLTLFLAACPGKDLNLNPPPPPESYMTCKELPAVPPIDALQPIRASNGALVYMKSEVDARDGDISRFIVNLRNAWFDCSNQLAKVRDYYAAQE